MKKPCDRSGMGAPVNMPQRVNDGWDGGPGAVFDEEAGHGGAEACRCAEALALSMSPRLNSQNPGLFCQLLVDDKLQALKLTQAIFALKSRRAPARHLLQAICAQCIYLNLNKPPRAQTRRSTSKANFRWR